MKLNEFLSKVDCTTLEASAVGRDFAKMTKDACDWGCRAVCVPMGAYFACQAAIRGWRSENAMHPHDVKLATVIDFPDGALNTDSRTALVREAKRLGFHEVDVVMRIGHFLDGDYGFVDYDVSLGTRGFLRYVDSDIEAIVRAAQGMKVKVIVETGYLNDQQILNSAKMVVLCAHYWKTSTGRDPKVSIEEKARHIRLVREAFPKLKIKAAGGIRTQEDVLLLDDAGADIFGISWPSLKEIISHWK